jgi:predicted ArsR family transcriptional regulator
MKMNELDLQERILQCIRESELGASISEISKKLGVNRLTVSKYLEVMRAHGLVDYKEVGMAKVWFIGKGSLIADLLNEILFNVMPRHMEELHEKNAEEILTDMARKATYDVFSKREMFLKQMREFKDFEDKILYCYRLSAAVGSWVDYRIVEETTDHIKIKVLKCPHIDYTKENPLACFSCQGIKLGTLKALFGIDVKKIKTLERIATGSDYCLFELPKA